MNHGRGYVIFIRWRWLADALHCQPYLGIYPTFRRTCWLNASSRSYTIVMFISIFLATFFHISTATSIIFIIFRFEDNDAGTTVY